MIKDKVIALKISDLMLEVGSKLNDSVAIVMEHCDEEEFKTYRRAVGKIMGDMLIEIMNPLYEIHPDIKPKKLK